MAFMDKQKEEHKAVIEDFLDFINSKTDKYVLKGGTALMECYELDRFSEDIDFDSKRKEDVRHKNIIEHISDFCEERGYTYRIGKDTETVKRCFINYGNDSRPLKIETSYRHNVDDMETAKIKGIETYTINNLAEQKCNAYRDRTKVRDIYDLSFITVKYHDQLLDRVLDDIKDTFEYKGVEYFDYIASQEKDPLVKEEKLEELFLSALYTLDVADDSNVDQEMNLNMDMEYDDGGFEDYYDDSSEDYYGDVGID